MRMLKYLHGYANNFFFLIQVEQIYVMLDMEDHLQVHTIN